MKFKLFILILLSLLVLSAVVLFVQGSYFQNERMLLLDQQIRNSAEEIVDSEFANLGRYDSSKADRIISDELGTERVGKFFVVWDGENRKLYESLNILELGLTLPRAPKVITKTVGNNLIRAINFDLPQYPERTMQVGIIVDKSFIDWSFIGRSTLIYVAVLLTFILIVALVLLKFLFQPIRKLADELRIQTGSVPRAEFDLSVIDKISKIYPAGRRDEFGDLVDSIRTLMIRINSNLKFQKIWAFQMAHEIKTPLFMMQESLSAENPSALDLQRAKEFLEKCHFVISDFLSWAEVATLQSKPALFAIRIEDVVKRLSADMSRSFPGRIEVVCAKDFTVIGNANHLDQLISNLLMNALLHTDGRVLVSLTKRNELRLEDTGPGIDPKILEKMGSPFNKGNRKARNSGSGLGLAWVKILCDLYDWKLRVESGSQGTKISIQFPEVEPFE